MCTIFQHYNGCCDLCVLNTMGFQAIYSDFVFNRNAIIIIIIWQFYFAFNATSFRFRHIFFIRFGFRTILFANSKRHGEHGRIILKFCTKWAEKNTLPKWWFGSDRCSWIAFYISNKHVCHFHLNILSAQLRTQANIHPTIDCISNSFRFSNTICCLCKLFIKARH